MPVQFTLIRTLASVIFFLRQRSFRDPDVRIVVISGSVGKTIMRKTLTRALREHHIDAFTLDSEYVNELGVLLSLLAYDGFSVWSFHSWRALLSMRPRPGRIILIELGADFRTDIMWFLRRMRPDIVILTKGTTVDWTGRVPQVLFERLMLTQAVKEKVFVSQRDPVHRQMLDAANIAHTVVAHEHGIYEYPRKLTEQFLMQLGVESRTMEPYTKNRYSLEQHGNKILIKDMYKVTPLCLQHCLSALENTPAKKRILVMSGMRPQPGSHEKAYGPFLAQLRRIDHIFFIGDPGTLHYLAAECSVTGFGVTTEKEIARHLADELNEGSVAVCILTSSFYSLPQLRALRIGSKR